MRRAYEARWDTSPYPQRGVVLFLVPSGLLGRVGFLARFKLRGLRLLGLVLVRLLALFSQSDSSQVGEGLSTVRRKESLTIEDDKSPGF